MCVPLLLPQTTPPRLSPFSNSESPCPWLIQYICLLRKINPLCAALRRFRLWIRDGSGRFRQGRGGRAQTLKFPPPTDSIWRHFSATEVHNPQTSSSTSRSSTVITQHRDHQTSAPTTARTIFPFDLCWPVESSFGTARRCARREPALRSRYSDL
ncbi:hypothetical protein N431DRAFT_221643 [Stipitochalara longipes BDJ]|nr:hypothetical protein N431DRAFT_221643 [Stipitochalara longipes BDJ]